MDYIYFWFIASILFFLMEALGVTGIGFLFAALGAFCTGILAQLDYLPATDYLAQGAVFFTLSALWAVVLWKPLKNLRLSRPAENHHDMIGRYATVTEAGLVKDSLGQAHWSGTTLRARLADDASIASAAAGEELKIVAVDGSTLILAQKDYAVDTPS